MSACGEYLSHAEGLNLLRGQVQGCYIRLVSNGRTGSCLALTLRSKLDRLTVSSSFSLRFLFCSNRRIHTDYFHKSEKDVQQCDHCQTISCFKNMDSLNWSPTESQESEMWRSFLSAVEVCRKSDKEAKVKQNENIYFCCIYGNKSLLREACSASTEKRI